MSESQPRVPWPIRLIFLSSLSLLLITTLTEHNRVRGLRLDPPASTTKSANDQVIVPGFRVGLLTLGLSSSQVAALLGKGQAAPHHVGQITLYPDYGLALYFENNRLNSITVRNPAFETRHKIKVGVSADTVLKGLGSKYEMDGPPDDYTLHSWEKGIHVSVKDDKVTHIMVTAGLEIPVNDSN